ncbi:MAG: hypothetical protein GY851_01950 [bacterium]|nr:hypothetical protein [bacterium]
MNRMRASAEGLLVIEWRDAGHNEISRTTGLKWNAKTTSRMRWTRVFIEDAEVPRHTSTAVIGIHLVEDLRPGGGGFFVDDVEFTRTSTDEWGDL